MKNKVIMILSVFLLCFGASILVLETARAADPFTDVSSFDYFSSAVSWAVKNEITKGTSATTFSPYDTCTRAQVVTFLWRANGCPELEEEITNSFQDVREGAYYYNAVLWAIQRSITNGTTKTTFSPYQNCTRAQILTMLWRNANSPAVSEKGEIATTYSDHWAVNAIAWAESKEMLSGNKGAFDPDENCPRADVVFYLYNVSENDMSNNEVNADGEAEMENDAILYEATSYEDFAQAVITLIQEYIDKVEQNGGSESYATGRLIVKTTALPSLAEYHAVRIIKGIDMYYIVQFMTDKEAELCAEYLQTLPEIEYVEPDVIMTADADYDEDDFSTSIE